MIKKKTKNHQKRSVKDKDGKYKILLILPKQEDVQINYNYAFPMGLSYISTILKRADYDVDCINLNHMPGTINEILKLELVKKRYDFIGTGHVCLGYPIVQQIIDSIRIISPQSKIILGGIIMMKNEPKLMFEYLNPDFGIIGEGEVTIIELLKAIEHKKDLREVNGIIYRDENNNTIITDKRELIQDLDTIPFPDFGSFDFKGHLDNSKTDFSYITNIFDKPRVYPILGSRSCPFQCTFCYHDTNYRERSLKNIFQEIRFAIKKYDINKLVLYDDCFSAKKDRVIKFCEGMKNLMNELGREIKWDIQLMVISVDDLTLKMLKEAGCDVVSYGFESFSLKILQSMKKPITPEQIDFAFKETLAAGMTVQANFIFGDPAETVETYNQTLKYWKDNCLGQVNLFFVQPYPGSQIFDYCLKKGIIKDKLDFIKTKLSDASGAGTASKRIIFDLGINMTSMTDKQFKKMKKKIISYRTKFLPLANVLEIDQSQVLLVCPFCGKKVHYKNCLIKSKFLYDFPLVCRNCKKSIQVRSLLKNIGYKFYPLVHPPYLLYKKLKYWLNQKSH